MSIAFKQVVRLGLLAAIVASATPGTAQAQSAFAPVSQAEWAKIVSAARGEGRVVVYGGPTAQTGAQYKAAFEKQYPGITLEYTRLFGQQLMVKLEQERNGNLDGADFVITPELPWIADEVTKNAFKAPVGPANAAWPARFTASGVAPLLALEPFIMAVNTNLVKTPVTGYADLLRPEFKGRIGIVEPVAAVLIAWYDWLEKTQGGEPAHLCHRAAHDAGGHRRRDSLRRVHHADCVDTLPAPGCAGEDGGAEPERRHRLRRGGRCVGEAPQCGAGVHGLHDVASRAEFMGRQR